jgi:V8-like Glu-specific endopeptidase
MKFTLITSLLVVLGLPALGPLVGHLTPTARARDNSTEAATREHVGSPAHPLDPGDPGAQLDPALLEAPPMPTPPLDPMKQTSPRSPAEREWLLQYEIATGEVSEVEYPPEPAPQGRGHGRRATRPRFWPGYVGAATDLEESEGSGDVPADAPQKVIGTDDRVKINNTATYPWSTQCKLYMTFPSGRMYQGSGTLIGSRYVLTAGHNVYDHAERAFVSKILVVPGMNGNAMPFGAVWAQRYVFSRRFVDNLDQTADYAVLSLRPMSDGTEVGTRTGWLGLTVCPDPSVGLTVNIAGYPGDRDGGACQYRDSDPITAASQGFILFTVDTGDGHSGSAVYLYRVGGAPPGRYVLGVHIASGSGNYNVGTPIDRPKYDAIVSLLRAGS